jgi:adenosylmethionine-8-amino-7-oxononanoate aminotransferase
MSPEVSRLAALAPQPPEAQDLLALDREHLWHPYSSMTSPGTVYPVESASGVRLRMRVGGEPVEVVDAMSSWWCAIHGYAVPELDAAAVEQLGRMSHVMFGGLTHEPAVRLAQQLVELAPGTGLDKVFFADSGSVSVEVAMKMAWQAHAAGGLSRTKFFTIRGGYHGDTFSPMSVTDPEGGMHSMYAGFLPRHVFADRPPRAGEPLDDWVAATTALFEQHAGEIAAVIVEPVLQGAGGMHVYDPEAVRHLASLARAHGALVIFDEIATGLWRTGAPWAADHVGIAPDILCTGKALTGGYLTLAAVLTTAEVAARVDASPAGAMMHGPTFMANPLACAIASANLDLLASYDAAGTIERLGKGLHAGLAPAADFGSVADVRVLGAVGVIELHDAVDVARVTAAALARGVWVRPFRNLVYTMPPYVTTDDDLATITGALVGAVEEVHGA